MRGDGHVLLEEALGRLGLLGGFDLGEHHVGVCRGAGVEDCGGQISGGQAFNSWIIQGSRNGADEKSPKRTSSIAPDVTVWSCVAVVINFGHHSQNTIS